MRIRKNSNFSKQLLGTAGYGGEIPETYKCHLNQSPWDVIPVTFSVDGNAASEFTSLLDSSWFLPSSSSSPPLIQPFEKEDSFTAKKSLDNSNGAAERLNSSVERLNLNTAEDYKRSPVVEEPKPIDLSDNTDKKSRAVEPDTPLKISGDDDQVAISMPPPPPKRGRPRGTAKKAQTSTAASKNPYEFYYYSGFGPRWGRKRGGSSDSGEKKLMENNNNNMSQNTSGAETAAFGGGSSSVDCVEEDQDNDHGKKKTKMMMKKKKRGRGSL